MRERRRRIWVWWALGAIGVSCALNAAVVWAAGNLVLRWDRRYVREVVLTQDRAYEVVTLRGWGFRRNILLQDAQGKEHRVDSATPLTRGELGPGASVEEVRGWPFWCVYCAWVFETQEDIDAGEPRLVGGFGPARGWPAPPGLPWPVLPYTPLWRGVVLNGVVMGVGAVGPAMLMVWAAGRARRRRRVRQGRCVACGYTLSPGGAAAVCPECGWVDEGLERT